MARLANERQSFMFCAEQFGDSRSHSPVEGHSIIAETPRARFRDQRATALDVGRKGIYRLRARANGKGRIRALNLRLSAGSEAMSTKSAGIPSLQSDFQFPVTV